MNILHLTHTDINSDSRILKEINSLNNANKEYIVSGIGVVLNEELHKTKQNNSINIQSIDLKTRNWVSVPTALRHIFSLIELTFKMILKIIKLKPEVIHCHDTLVLPLGAIVKIYTGAKLIYDAHELESEKNGLTKTLGRMTLFVEKILWKSIDALIVVSPSIDSWYEENIGNKYTEIILNSPEFKDSEDIDKMYLRKKFSIPYDSKIYIYIGILAAGRGIDLIIDSFINLNNKIHLVFLGYGEYRDKLIKLSLQYSHIHLHDSVPHEDVVSIAKSADVGLCLIENISLSDFFCLPNKLFEYAFSEIPVLASNFPDISKVVQQYNLGKCCELNSESVHQAIRDFDEGGRLPKIDLESLYNLSWGAQDGKLLKLYKKILEDKR
jgi:glycosyltransferase involved in cell wall biosynthesis